VREEKEDCANNGGVKENFPRNEDVKSKQRYSCYKQTDSDDMLNVRNTRRVLEVE
jgi:hypothetical protein